MNYIAKENLKFRSGNISGHFGPQQRCGGPGSGSLSSQNSHVSQNLGRIYAGRSIVDSIALNHKLCDSVSAELQKQISEEEKSQSAVNKTVTTATEVERSNPEYTITQIGQSMVSLAG